MNENEGGAQEGAPQKDNKAALYGGLVLVIIAAIAAYWWWTSARPLVEQGVDDTAAKEEPAGFGGEVSRRVEESARKASGSVPDASPLGGIEANPYDSYKNPFSR